MTRLLFLMVPSFVLAVMRNGANAADGCSPGAPMAVSLTPAAVVTCCGTQYTITLDAYDNDDCNDPPFKDYLAIAGWPGPVPVRGVDGHYRATLTRSHAEPGDYSFTVTVSDNTTTHYANDPADAHATCQVEALGIDARCVDTWPGARRSTIGVGEQVTCTSSQEATWSVSGLGSINQTAGTETTLTAGSSKGYVTVTAACRGATCNTTFNIVEPSELQYCLPFPELIQHQHGMCSAGAVLEMTVGPTNVSFSRIELRELAAPAFASGCIPPLAHQQGSPVGVYDLYNLVKNYDHVVFASWACPDSQQTSTTTWEIPLVYGTLEEINADRWFGAALQTTSVDTGGLTTITKNNISFAAAQDAPTQPRLVPENHPMYPERPPEPGP